jgi:hypothetical protein
MDSHPSLGQDGRMGWMQETEATQRFGIREASIRIFS